MTGSLPVADLTKGSSRFAIIPCGKELWTNFNKYNFSPLRTLCYHLCYCMIKCAEILYTHFISCRNSFNRIFYYRYGTSTLDSPGSRILIIYGKIDGWFISKLLCFPLSHDLSHTSNLYYFTVFVLDIE